MKFVLNIDKITNVLHWNHLTYGSISKFMLSISL
uniref:Uncharacterized protein n=1 Tax=Arundo donax TaxID=35708 RepID=A0A0A8YNP4_ARUDO